MFCYGNVINKVRSILLFISLSYCFINLLINPNYRLLVSSNYFKRTKFTQNKHMLRNSKKKLILLKYFIQNIIINIGISAN